MFFKKNWKTKVAVVGFRKQQNTAVTKCTYRLTVPHRALLSPNKPTTRTVTRPKMFPKPSSQFRKNSCNYKSHNVRKTSKGSEHRQAVLIRWFFCKLKLNQNNVTPQKLRTMQLRVWQSIHKTLKQVGAISHMFGKVRLTK